jgi:hypothetical protein
VSETCDEANRSKRRVSLSTPDESDMPSSPSPQAQADFTLALCSVQNALPIWHTHSTVTGSATSLGLEDARKANKLEEEARRRATAGHTIDDGDDALAAHYADLDAPPPVIKPEPGLDQVQAHELEDEDESMVVKVEPGVDGVRQGFAVNGNGGVGNGNGLPEDEEAEEDEGELETAGTTPAAEKASGVMVMGESGRVDATSSLVLQLTPRKSQGFRSRWTTSPRRIRSS